MKKSWLFLLSLFSINLVSAAYYGGFSFRNLFASLNPNDVFLGVAFILFLFFLIKAFSKFSKDQYGNPSGAAWIPALALSIGLTYGLTRVNFDITNFFYSFGFAEDFLMAFLGIILIIGMLYAIKKKKFKYFLIGFGILFIVLSFTEIIYEKGAAAAIGIVLILFGFKFWRIFGILFGLRNWKIFKKKDKIDGGYENNNGSNNQNQSQIIVEQRRRVGDYKHAYMDYLFRFNNSRTPHQRRRILQAMNACVREARRLGVRERRFLSNTVGGRNAISPREVERRARERGQL